MKSKTETLSAALRILANDIQSPDDVPATCLREAADRLEELARERNIETKRADGHYENYCEILKKIDSIANQRDEARDEVERLEKLARAAAIARDQYREQLQILKRSLPTRLEPSRLEIAAMLAAAWFANADPRGFAAETEWAWFLGQADALIATARECE
jgi:chromosome segregation ATPase